MSVGELWIANPLFPWVAIVLAAWVAASTAVQVRTWIRIRRLEKANKFLQELIMGGIYGLSNRLTKVKKERRGRGSKSRSRRRRNKSESSDSQGHRIQSDEPEPAAIEEVEEDGDTSDNAVRATSESTV